MPFFQIAWRKAQAFQFLSDKVVLGGYAALFQTSTYGLASRLTG